MSLLAFTPNTALELLVGAGLQSNVALPGTGRRIRIANGGGAQVHVWFYEAGTTPPTLLVASSMMIPAGAIEVFSVASDTTRIAILNDGTAASAINLCRGEGQ